MTDTAKQQARTALGKRLREIRARIVKTGCRLLSWDDVERELRDRRGEHAEAT